MVAFSDRASQRQEEILTCTAKLSVCRIVNAQYMFNDKSLGRGTLTREVGK